MEISKTCFGAWLQARKKGMSVGRKPEIRELRALEWSIVWSGGAEVVRY